MAWGIHLLFVGCCTYFVDRFINEAVRRWLWGIHLLQRLRIPPGFPLFPREPKSRSSSSVLRHYACANEHPKAICCLSDVVLIL